MTSDEDSELRVSHAKSLNMGSSDQNTQGAAVWQIDGNTQQSDLQGLSVLDGLTANVQRVLDLGGDSLLHVSTDGHQRVAQPLAAVAWSREDVLLVLMAVARSLERESSLLVRFLEMRLMFSQTKIAYFVQLS